MGIDDAKPKASNTADMKNKYGKKNDKTAT